MFRQSLRLHRRAYLGAATGAAVLVHEHESKRDKLPIYPRPESEILLQEVPSELEHQISKVRLSVTDTYTDARTRVQAVVSRWISVEQSVENRLKSLLAPEEQLNPSLLYVGVATLTGSVLARNRNILLRAFLPPTLLVLSFAHFLPRTADNISNYLGGLEEKYAPDLARVHDTAKAHTAMSWEMLKDRTQEGRETIGRGVARGVDTVQDATGLKIREAIGWARQREPIVTIQTEKIVEQAVAVAAQAEKVAEQAVAAVVEKAEEAKVAVTEAVEEAKAPAPEKTSTNPPKRLV